VALSHVLSADVVLKSQPADLAGVLLKHLDMLHKSGTKLNLHNFGNDSRRDYGENDAIEMALKETWAVLEREGFLTRDKDDWYFISRRGEDAISADAFDSFRVANLLPKDMLHPDLLPNVWGAFIRGQYDTAVFEAFKEVEIAVRKAAKYSDAQYGTDMMRDAFHTDTGPLTDPNSSKAERQALSDLFAGAIGSYKNPHSHRRVRLGPKESVEMIVLASHLLAIVESRPVDK
jgi:uncharacterized protein (TIGR02391 family)